MNAPHVLKPNVEDISAHLHALFAPGFVHHFPDAQIEVVYGPPGVFTGSRWFSPFDPKTIIDFVEVRNAHGDNVYIGAALRKGAVPEKGRAKTDNFFAASCGHAEFDSAGDAERIDAIIKEQRLEPAIVVTTGTTPCLRGHLYFRIKGGITDAAMLKEINSRLRDLFGSDDVTDAIRIMRLGGCINYPTEKKHERGYVAELVTVKIAQQPREYSIEELMALRPTQPRQHSRCDFSSAPRQSSLGFKFARSDDDISQLLQKSKTLGQWHNSMRDAIASMIGHRWADDAIRSACAPYCQGGVDDPDLAPLIEGARQKWNKPNGQQDGRTAPPTIQIEDGELSSLATRGEEVLIAADVAIYQRGGRLVRPIIETVDATRGRQTNIVQLKALDDVYLRDLLCRNARWEKYSARSKKLAQVNPPSEVAQTILARTGDWRFPTIAGVISAPTMRPDGSLLTEPGYDKATRLLLVEPPPMPAIPEKPTREDAERALALLEALLTGFPFDDDVAKACALSAMITPVVRGAFPVTPMHASRAPTAGSGKSFLWDIVAAIVIGQPMPVLSTGASVEETEKRLGSALMAGQPLISIDNISGELGGDALCQIIERPFVDVRILGRSESVRVEARGTSLFATGNNFVIVGDVCRRTVTTNLDPRVERPELRQFDFDPVDRVLANRGQYIAAALTICRAYFVSGRPNMAPRLASFEGWSDTVRSALIWLGKEDPVKSMETARAEDPERAELSDMLEAWSEVMGTGGENRRKLTDVLLKGLSISRETQQSELEPTFPDFHAALMAMAQRSTGRSVQPDARMFGKWLQRFKGRIVDGRRFMFQSDAKRGNEWWVEKV
jgi:putative DNA primase/helicase